MPRKVCEPNREGLTRKWRKLLTRGFTQFIPDQILLGCQINNELGEACGMYGEQG